jgi:AAA domain
MNEDFLQQFANGLGKRKFEQRGYRRVCLFAGPGAGKSTTAFWIMWRLKSLGIQADMSREWIKRWAFAKRPMDRLTDQIIVMGAQVNEECEALATGAVVVTDSPVLLQAAYSHYQEDIDRALIIERGLQERYPTCNIFIDRYQRGFDGEGRWEGEQAAIAKDAVVLDLMNKAGLEYISVRHDDYNTLWKALTT